MLEQWETLTVEIRHKNVTYSICQQESGIIIIIIFRRCEYRPTWSVTSYTSTEYDFATE